jgi:hypothetical protein
MSKVKLEIDREKYLAAPPLLRAVILDEAKLLMRMELECQEGNDTFEFAPTEAQGNAFRLKRDA